jgi:hypothetical protein
MSSYTSNIPQPTDNPSSSQDQILQNFQSISTTVAVNHVQFNDADQGKHKFLQMPEESSAPSTASNEGALYTKDTGSAPNLFWRNESNGTEQQMTNTIPVTVSPNRHWNFSDGLQIRLGIVTHTGTNTPVVFSSPFSSVEYTVMLTPIGAAGLVSGWNAQNLSTTGFTMASSGSGGGNSFYYMAYGS